MRALVILCLCLPTIFSYKILMICSPPSKSHYNLCSAVTNILTERNHNVTFITAFEAKNPKYRQIVTIGAKVTDKFPSTFEMSNASMRKMFQMMELLLRNLTDVIVDNPEVKALMEDEQEKFDLVILEYFMNDNLFGFSVKYDCPLILLVPMGLIPSLAMVNGNPLSIAHVPNFMSELPFVMNLWQRVQNFILTISSRILEELNFAAIAKELYPKHFPKESKIVKFEDLHKKISAVISNSHHTIGPVRPLLPNTIEVGGFHIEKPAPLPKDLEAIVTNSKHGVILFSLGSVVKTKDMTPEMVRLFVNTFGRFKETVLWKFDAEIKDLPKNVIVQKWIPQTAVLAHPNLKLFISHGGLLSCTESTYFGAPMLIIPIFGDQKLNARTFTDKGRAQSLNYFELTEDTLESTMREMLTNPKYKENSVKAQKLFHDRPINPRDHVGFIAEHIIRNGGGAHLSPPYLPKYSLLLLDVLAIILVPIIIIFAMLYFICRKCLRRNRDVKLKRN